VAGGSLRLWVQKFLISAPLATATVGGGGTISTGSVKVKVPHL
jgi:hypothetical protein